VFDQARPILAPTETCRAHVADSYRAGTTLVGVAVTLIRMQEAVSGSEPDG
jgi:hypothetical protein